VAKKRRADSLEVTEEGQGRKEHRMVSGKTMKNPMRKMNLQRIIKTSLRPR